jgi:hypothetical protein
MTRRQSLVSKDQINFPFEPTMKTKQVHVQKFPEVRGYSSLTSDFVRVAENYSERERIKLYGAAHRGLINAVTLLLPETPENGHHNTLWMSKSDCDKYLQRRVAVTARIKAQKAAAAERRAAKAAALAAIPELPTAPKPDIANGDMPLAGTQTTQAPVCCTSSTSTPPAEENTMQQRILHAIALREQRLEQIRIAINALTFAEKQEQDGLELYRHLLELHVPPQVAKVA